MALQISQAQGKAITGQYIFQLANQIAQNPNGVLAQAILNLVNQDDGGKSSHVTTVIKNYVKSSSSSRENGDRDGSPKCPAGQHYDSTTRKCVDDTSPDPCKKDPKPPGCPPPPDCKKDPTAKGCEPSPPPCDPSTQTCPPPPEELPPEELPPEELPPEELPPEELPPIDDEEEAADDEEAAADDEEAAADDEEEEEAADDGDDGGDGDGGGDDGGGEDEG
jgi:hypothetical protein